MNNSTKNIQGNDANAMLGDVYDLQKYKVGDKHNATIKYRHQIEDIAMCFSGGGWILKGQFFWEENLELSGKEFEFEKAFRYCWAAIIDGEWRYFSEEALIFDKKSFFDERFNLWLKSNYDIKQKLDIDTLRNIFDAMDEQDK